MYKVKLAFLSLIFLSACSSSSEDMIIKLNDEYAKESVISSNRLTSQSKTAGQEYEGKKDLSNRIIIKNAQIKMEVRSLKESTENIKAILASQDGYLSNGQMYQAHRELNQFLEFRIPKDNFENALAEIRNQSIKIIQETINSRDVSEEFVDIQSRLKTKREVRDRYIAVLRNKASTIEEILLAEETIRKLQEEIEAKEGRLKYLMDQTSYSTIKINLVEFI